VSHELRTPLHGCLGSASLLSETTTLDSEQRDYVRVIQRSGEHLLAVLDDILDFSKFESGRLEIEAERVSIAQMIEQAIELSFTPKPGLELIYSVAPSVPPVVLGDATRLTQITANLLSNASKFTNAGQVHVRVGVMSAAEIEQQQRRVAQAIAAAALVDATPITEEADVHQEEEGDVGVDVCAAALPTLPDSRDDRGGGSSNSMASRTQSCADDVVTISSFHATDPVRATSDTTYAPPRQRVPRISFEENLLRNPPGTLRRSRSLMPHTVTSPLPVLPAPHRPAAAAAAASSAAVATLGVDVTAVVPVPPSSAAACATWTSRLLTPGGVHTDPELIHLVFSVSDTVSDTNMHQCTRVNHPFVVQCGSACRVVFLLCNV
jgi:hypothetical protein